jgi:hypothetical protein
MLRGIGGIDAVSTPWFSVWSLANYCSIFGLCPDTDPTLIGYDNVKSMLAFYDEPLADCAPYFEEYSCVGDLGFNDLGVSYLTATPTSTGTQTLYTTGGSVTRPVSGSTFTWTANGVPRTVTAAKAQNTGSSDSSTSASSASASSGGSSGGSSAAASAAGTGTGDSASSSSSSSSSRGNSRGASLGLPSLAVGFLLLAAIV